LATLVTIENTRYCILQNRLFKGCDTKTSIHRIRQLPRQYLPGIDVNDAHKVHRSPWRYPEVHIADESKAPDASALPLWFSPVQLFVLFLKTHSILEASQFPCIAPLLCAPLLLSLYPSGITQRAQVHSPLAAFSTSLPDSDAL